VVVAVGVDEARGGGVDEDAFLAEFVGVLDGQGVQGGFGG
jgi:hypothetical protein